MHTRITRHLAWLLLSLGMSLSLTGAVFAQDLPKPEPTPGHVMLPQEHQYQRVLRQYMATLTEKDFEHGVTVEKLMVPPVNPDMEYQYRTYIMAMTQQPHVGGKRGIPAINAPSHNYLLSTIEGEKTIIVPPVWTEALATFIKWDSPSNVFHNNRALKMRAFVAAGVKMMMVDDYLEKNAGAGSARADWNGYNLIGAASAYPVFKEELPPAVRQAYEAGLLRLGRKLLAMGPKGESCDNEMSAAVGLWYVAHATGDAAFTREAEAYARTLCTDPTYFHPAGYWTERGGLDVGFGGMANFWTVWLALASDWPFAKETVDKAYRLRAHLSLPEPDGTFSGPSAFNNRLGSPACEDQWDWDGSREPAAAMITDEAVCQFTLPTEDRLADAMARRIDTFNDHLYGNLKNAPYTYPDGKRYQNDDPKTGRYLKNEEITGHPWIWRIFPNGFNYPIEVIPGYEFYRKGAYAHLADLRKQDSPMLKSPYLRDGSFLRNFENAFIVTKQSRYAAILHTGPVGLQTPDDGFAQFKGPMGFGGGQLTAFWTPSTGAVILGRRGGMRIAGTETIEYDKPEWRAWPIHAVSGSTRDGKIFTSARITKPMVVPNLKKNSGTVTVSGVMPAEMLDQGTVLTGRIDYRRVFRLDRDSVRVETTVQGDGKDAVAELYETLPIFLRDTKKQASATPTVIEFQVGGQWIPATAEYQEKVTAIKLTRFTGAVQIKFTKPQRVKLSPEEWQDTFLTKAVCRNVLIDLLGGGDFTGEKTVSYTISAITK